MVSILKIRSQKSLHRPLWVNGDYLYFYQIYFLHLETIEAFKLVNLRSENENVNNFRMVDIEINTWSFLFLNLKTNLILYLSSKVYKIQPIRVSYQKPGNLKFCAPFKINIQKREGLPNFLFFSTISKKEWIQQEIKSAHIGYLD